MLQKSFFYGSRSGRPRQRANRRLAGRRPRFEALEDRRLLSLTPDVNYPVVVKKDGSRADFDAGKVRASMMLALRKRPVSIEQIDDALLRIEQKLLASAQREIPSHKLGELVMRELKKLDKVAYVRFASVYRSFEDVEEFRQLLRDI